MGIGTITSDSAMMVRFVNGPKLGTIEESFIAKLKPGDSFVFAGRCLRLVQTRDMTAYVRKQTRFDGTVPRWMGGRMPLSTQLGQAMRSTFSHVKAGYGSDPELICIDPILKLQERWSHIPHADELLVETSHSRDGDHLFVFPFEGRLVHEGLGALFAFRLAQIEPRSVSVTATDYGFELLSPQPLTIDETIWHQLTATDRLAEDLLGCVNSTEMAKRQFRDIARVAGLVMTGFPGQNKSTRQLQASSELFYDVFAEFDPENLLLDQARREVLEQQLELRRLRAALERMSRATMVVRSTRRFSPLAFPIWAERIRGNHVSTEKWADRVQRMVVRLEKAAQRESNQSKQHAKHGRKRNASHGS
jgi:ATP-dependent Lhr-like helicase